MSYNPMSTPHLWYDLMNGYEVFGAKGCSFGNKCNILVQPNDISTSVDHRIFDDLLVVPFGLSLEATRRGALNLDEEGPLGTYKFLWDISQNRPSSRFWILEADLDDSMLISDFRVGRDATILPLGDFATDQFRCLELFAGGYGGWHFATTLIEKFWDKQIRVTAIDNDLEACRNYAITHDVKLISGTRMLSTDLLHKFHGDCIIHCDISSKFWLPLVTNWRPHCVCISAPCPQWSLSGMAKGLDSFEGLLFAESIALCKFIQPKVVIIEQVAGFAQHSHKMWILKTIANAGFRVVWSKTIDINSICPTHRPRWIAILMHQSAFESEVSSKMIKLWQQSDFPSPLRFGSVFAEDMATDSRLFPDDAARRILESREFLPPNKRCRVSNPFENRVQSKDVQTQTFMASYTSQHCLSDDHLRQKGCFTQLIQSDFDIGRYWHPGEVFMLHLGISHFYIDGNWKNAYKFLGNQISVVHAIFGLVNAINLVWKPSPQISIEVMTYAISQRVTAENMILSIGDNGMFVVRQDIKHKGTDRSVASALAQLHSYGATQLPHDMVWDFFGLRPLSEIGKFEIVEIPNPIEAITQSENLAADVEQEIPPTCPFVPFLLAILHCETHQEKFWIASDVNPGGLCQLWDGKYEVSTDAMGVFHLNPIKRDTEKNSPFFVDSDETMQPIAIVMCSDRMHIVNISKIDDTALQCFQQLGVTSVFNQFGKINEASKIFQYPFFTSIAIEHGNPTFELPFVFAALQQVEILLRTDSKKNVLSYAIEGSQPAIATVFSLFEYLFVDDSIKSFGRKIIFIENRIEFQPSKEAEALPFAQLRIAIVVALTRILVSQLQQPSGCHLIVKWIGQILIDMHCDPNTTGNILQECLAIAFRFFESNVSTNLICNGNRCDPTQKISQHRISESRQAILMHLIRGFHGGGPGSKQQQRVQIKNSLAGSLLEQGHDLKWISSAVDKVCDSVGIQKLAPIASMAPGPNREQKIRQVFADSGCEIPPKPEKAVLAPQTLQMKAKKKVPPLPSPSDLIVDCEFLTNADGSKTQQLSEFKGQSSGVYLTTSEAATPWLREGQILSADELGMLVIGELQVQCKLPHKKIHVPCKDGSSRDILLAATLVQFGTKHIAIKDLDQHIAQGTECKVVAFTLWKSEWNEEDWHNACSNTIRFIKDIFAKDNLAEAIVASWGRSTRNGKQVSTIHEATSIQVHSSIQSEKFHQVLAKSGFNRVWSTPKNEHGRLSDEYRVIWFEGDIHRAVSLAASLNGATGLIQGKKSFGLRFTSSAFSTAWKHIHPGQSEPEFVTSSFVYKIEPLPFGCSPEQLKNWGDHIKWQFKAIKATGPRSWIVFSATEPPATNLVFNGQPLLVRLLPPKINDKTTAIVAGPRTVKPQANQQQNAILDKDPWAAWKGPRLAAPPISVSHPSAPVAAPSEQRLQQQDDKILGLEKQISQMSKHFEKQGAQISQVQDELQKTEIKLAKQVKQTIDDVKNELTSSLKDAMTLQNQQFNDNMKDLRLLLQQSQQKRKAAPDNMETDT